ncbi:MAG: hypothetical protein EBR82_16250 [Caulobacteraceae bacterium]|nr:hypothetical protein [Caulobacteraceae bacterium]
MNKLVKNYVREVILSEFYISSFAPKKKKKKKKGFLSKVKSVLTGGFLSGKDELEDAVEEWIEDQEDRHDFQFPEKVKKKIEKISLEKYEKYLQTSGDPKKASEKAINVLNDVFRPYFKQIDQKRQEELKKELEADKESLGLSDRGDKRKSSGAFDDDEDYY